MEEKVLAFWEKNNDIREIHLPAGGRRGVRLLRRPPVRHRPAPLWSFRSQHGEGRHPPLPDHEGPQGGQALRLGLPRPPRRVRDGEGAGDLREEADRRVRRGEVQRGLPVHRPALHEGVAEGHHAPGALGGLRQRLQDHGPRLHGDDLVGRERALEEGPPVRGLLHPPVLSPLLHGAFELRAEPRRLPRRGRPGHHGEVRAGRRAGHAASWRGPPPRGRCRPISGWHSAPKSATSRSKTGERTTSSPRTGCPPTTRTPRGTRSSPGTPARS